MTLNLT